MAKTMRKTLEQLKAEYDAAKKVSDELRIKFMDREFNERTPILKKKLEGKYFVFRNSYSSDKSWNLYIYVKKVVGPYDIIAYQFETDSNRETRIKTTSRAGDSVLSKEISKGVFMEEYKRMRERTAFKI